jgi:hypothetical protein
VGRIVTNGSTQPDREPADDPDDTPPTLPGWRRHPALRIAAVAIVAAVAALGYFGHGRATIRVRPGGAVFDNEVLPTFFLVAMAAALVALRWPLIGAILGVFTVAALIPFAITQLEPWSAVATIVAFAVPAALWIFLGLERRRRRPSPRADFSRRRLLLALGGVTVAAAGGGLIGRYVYRRIWGPTHPESEVSALPASALDWSWCGAMTSESCAIRARPHDEFEDARLLIGTDPDLTGAEIVTSDSVFDRVVDFRVSGLTPATRYHYAVEVDGILDTTRSGSFRTFPVPGQPVRIVFAGCARIGSNGAVFDAIRAREPLLYVCLGDFHYGDNFVDDVDDYRLVFDEQLTRPAQAALYRSTPVAYVWDDHDYGPNDSNKDAPGRAAAMLAYREYVPHYELAGPTSAIYQAFTVGAVRVVMTDARSARDPQEIPDSAEKSMLGIDQRDWLLAELTESSPTHDLVIWVNPVPWVDPPAEGSDSWAGYATERDLIAEHIATEGIDNMLMVSGDAHMVAIDDGSHTNYSTSPGPGFPLIHVAALDRPGSTKGGPYTLGPIPGGGHFGVVDVTVGTGGVEVELTAADWRGEPLLNHTFAVPARHDA